MPEPFDLIDIPTRETADFIAKYLPPGSSLLEIGCGDGDLAKALIHRGMAVIALDTDSECVAKATAKGVNAIVAEWPDFQPETALDGIVFTRSLHHMHHLEDAIAHAWRWLKPDGWLLIEDFGFADAGDDTLAWFHQMLKLLRASGQMLPQPKAFALQFLEAKGERGAWHTNHGHHLHSAETMLATVEARFSGAKMTPAPYLYRYCMQVLPDSAEGMAMLESVLALEKLQGQASPGFLVGRRITARKPG